MYIQILRLAIVAAAFTFAAPVLGQGGFINSGYGISGAENCGRNITQQQAEGLWGDYCHENCAYTSSGSGGGGCRLKGGGCGLKGGGCGHSGGGFGGGYSSGFGGYSSGFGGYGGGGCGGGGCDDCGGGGYSSGFGGYSSVFGGYGGGGHAVGGGCGCKLKGLLGGGGGKLKGGGCGCKLKGGHGGGWCKLFGGCKKFGHSAQQCGTSGAYFEEAVGYEYGTGGIESCVSCNSCGSFDSLAAPYAQSMAAPYAQAQPLAAPYAEPQSVLGHAFN